jgi:hypothetical protein
MSGNMLIGTELSHNSVASGGTVMVSITYSADKAGQSIDISHDTGFSVSPPSVPAPTGEGVVATANLIVSRTSSTKASVLLTFKLGQSYKWEMLRVTS